MFLRDYCTFQPLSEKLIEYLQNFDCGHADLNDFFANDCLHYSKELIGKTYCFTLDSNPEEIVCAFTIANDSIKVNALPNSRRKKVLKETPRKKIMRSYPAVLIGRLGVNTKHKNKGVGRELMNFIKSWFVDSNNKTGCRFIVVDSYNEEIPLNYYQKNDFIFLFSSEEQEKAYMSLSDADKLTTRLLYFDLIVLKA